tara:strand:- start:849 stop:986 length:138 start_codon:yes stop_codon:yes gene_type:complete
MKFLSSAFGACQLCWLLKNFTMHRSAWEAQAHLGLGVAHTHSVPS